MTPDPAKQIAPKLTRWGKPWAYRELCLRGDALLRLCGIEQLHVRRRMVAHAMMAAGWRQNCWWFNCWSVKLGAWPGSWYSMDTWELIDGQKVDFPGTAWRAYSGWREAVDDYRIFKVKRYAEAKKLLFDAGATDRAFFSEMLNAGYATAKDPAGFVARAERFSKELAAATPDEIAAAELWAEEVLEGDTYDAGGGGADPDVDEDLEEDLVVEALLEQDRPVEEIMLEHLDLSLDEWSFAIINGILLVLGIITLAIWAAKGGKG